MNRLPIATVCSEARPHAINFCRKRVDTSDMHDTKYFSYIDEELVEYNLRQTTSMVATIALEEGPVDGPEDSFQVFKSAD